MARSWSSVASSGLPQPSLLRDPAPETPLPPRCYYCGSAADVCSQCAQMCSYSSVWKLKPVLKNGLCYYHGGLVVPHALYSSKIEEFIPQACSSCRAKNPWRAADCLEVTGFSYEKSCFSQPLSPINVVRVPIHRYIRIGQSKSTAAQRTLWAEEIYAKEMAFSGNEQEALRLREKALPAHEIPDVTLLGSPPVKNPCWRCGQEGACVPDPCDPEVRLCKRCGGY
jgi:hypothetical protein